MNWLDDLKKLASLIIIMVSYCLGRKNEATEWLAQLKSQESDRKDAILKGKDEVDAKYDKARRAIPDSWDSVRKPGKS